ncbi:hypothetical protein [Streptomyces sp. RKAG293]|uniref:hypothetical protein n=1 Tax=Streptomyces sp. RKAG293 TaxID=2893403 RepID=UPI0020337E9E|nr:hypothetical protein [Streptomyces sp. RKAG293]MCM2421467.1 hypothetical protein [Streptomyces sp. RKAG293]
MTATHGSAQAALLARILSDVPTDPPPPNETFPGADLLPPAFRRAASGPVDDSATVAEEVLSDGVERSAGGRADDPAPEPEPAPDDAIATAEATAEGLSGCVDPSDEPAPTATPDRLNADATIAWPEAEAEAEAEAVSEAASRALPPAEAPTPGLDAAGEIRARVVAALGYGPGTDGGTLAPELPVDGGGSYRLAEAAVGDGVLLSGSRPGPVLPVGDGGDPASAVGASGRDTGAAPAPESSVDAEGSCRPDGDVPDGSAEPAGRASASPPRRRGPADPVRGVMHRHEELCAGAVDVLEIAAGLEAHGVTDRVAGRFRHRDVFSLADELYARVPHGVAGERVAVRVGPVRVGLLHVVPGAGCASAAAFVVRSPAVGAVIALLVALATWAALRRGPLRAAGPGGALWGGWLLAFALCGGPLLSSLLGGPFDPPAGGPFVALALTLAPAAWCAHRFALRARAELTPSRGLGEFAARVRPLLAGTLVLYLAVLLALLWAAAALAGPAGVAGAAALGMLLFTARLLAVHGFTRAAAWGTGAAAAAEGAALGAAVLHHVPGLAAVSAPVEWLGPAAIPVLACGCAATVLVVHAFRALTRASAHGTGARTGTPAAAHPRTTDLRNTNQEKR